jgi:hypothetical protein
VDAARLVALVSYKPGWRFKVAGPEGRYLCVYAETPNSHHPSQPRLTQHTFPLPDDCDDERQFFRWVFDRLLLVEQHEAGEFFKVGEFRPFYPHHQDEGSPYVVVDRWDDR